MEAAAEAGAADRTPPAAVGIVLSATTIRSVNLVRWSVVNVFLCVNRLVRPLDRMCHITRTNGRSSVVVYRCVFCVQR